MFRRSAVEHEICPVSFPKPFPTRATKGTRGPTWRPQP
jgi:hypothetical protein